MLKHLFCHLLCHCLPLCSILRTVMRHCCFHTGLSDFLYLLIVFCSNFTMPCYLDSIMSTRKFADFVLLHFPRSGVQRFTLQPHSKLSRTFKDTMNVQIQKISRSVNSHHALPGVLILSREHAHCACFFVSWDGMLAIIRPAAFIDSAHIL
jgi:hypothetical protein